MRATDGGLGVFAVRTVHEGDSLCTIPKTAVLSVKTSGIADLLEENKIRGGLGLIIAILYEMSLHTASPWWGYLSELPSREYLPMFWTADELDLLQGTGVAQNVLEDLQHTQDDFETHVLPLVEQHPGLLKAETFTIDNFRRAASWVASRAFGVDSHHGMSLVPLADIFNHKAAIVWLSDEYAIEPVCFEDTYESGSEDEAAAACEGNGCREPGCTDDHHGSAPTSRGSLLQGLDSAAARRYQLELGICGAVRDDGVELLQIVAASEVPKGAEVHNTYGELGNVDLLSKYGFALLDNPFSVVVLNKASVLQAAERIMGVREMRLRCRFLRRESELLDEDAEPFEVLPQGCVGPSLIVALFVICADDQLFSGWGHIEDAIESMQVAQSAPVPATPSGARPYAEPSCTDKQDSHQNTRKRGREVSAGPMEDEQKVGRPATMPAQHSTLEQTGSKACDSSSSAQEQAKRGGKAKLALAPARQQGLRWPQPPRRPGFTIPANDTTWLVGRHKMSANEATVRRTGPEEISARAH
ncbi:g4393 [Coccomyxa viridis]|uniref:G4393 protein n=1 Tax=Coccomyxa viridis TaxID=1274662 RepID=A0ABP1FRQ1_9CHLO